LDLVSATTVSSGILTPHMVYKYGLAISDLIIRQ
jgi:hypothetical protein